MVKEDNNPVEILLATCNSARYLGELARSIGDQDWADWRLLVRDDGSCDGTGELIGALAREHPSRVRVLVPSKRADARENFSTLLQNSTAPYVMFCDHDDVWKPDKVSRSMEAMRRQEAVCGSKTPVLVFTDMEVADRELRRLHGSYFRYQHIDPARTRFHQLLVQNVPSGCTMLLNRALADLCRPIPPEAVMHDHWIALVAAAFGKIAYLDEPTLLYRQHGGNYYGASGYGGRYLVERAHRGPRAARQRFYQNVRQARAFLDRYGDRLAGSERAMLSEFASLEDLSWGQRRRVLIRHGLWKTGLTRNLGMLLII